MMGKLWREFRLAARALMKRPGFTILVVLTLSVGIGATSSIFSVVNAVLLTELPYQDADRLVFYRLHAGQLQASDYASWPEYRDFNEQSESMVEVGAAGGAGNGYVIIDEVPVSVTFSSASHNLFPMLGIRPILGRTFTKEDELIALPQPAPVVLSYSGWQNVYGGDPNIVGRTMIFEGGNSTEIVGVLPEGFDLELANGTSGGVGIWTVARPVAGADNYGIRYLRGLIGKLKPGVSIEAAQGEIDLIMERLVEQHPEANADGPDPRFRLVPLFDDIVGPVRATILILFAAVWVVFLVAGGNAASMLLARTATRQQELAVHAALGAGRATIARLVLMESAILALLAAVGGVLLADVGIRVLLMLEPGGLPRTGDVGVDAPVLAFTVLMGLLSVALFGLLPALKASSEGVMSHSLRQGSRIGAGVGSRARRALVVGQVAFSIVLLVSTGLLIRSFENLQQMDLGFQPANAISFRVRLDGRKFQNPEARWTAFRQFRDAVLEAPNVTAVGSMDMPLMIPPAQIWDTRALGRTQSLNAFVRRTVPGYLDSMRIPLVDGRLLTDEDVDATAQVAVINEALAEAFWPDVSPLGDWIEWNQGNMRRAQVVGVVGDARITSVDTPPTPQFYIPYTEQAGGGQIFVARFAGSSADVIPILHETAEQIGTDRVVDRITPLQAIIDGSTADARFAALLMTALGLVALLLSAVGVYGAISYIVTLRSKEVGIRIALGAQPRDVLGLNVREGLTLTVGGVVVGLLGAGVATRFLEVLLFGVGANDPATFATVAVAVILVGGVAALVPSVRATRVDPLVALQREA